MTQLPAMPYPMNKGQIVTSVAALLAMETGDATAGESSRRLRAVTILTERYESIVICLRRDYKSAVPPSNS